MLHPMGLQPDKNFVASDSSRSSARYSAVIPTLVVLVVPVVPTTMLSRVRIAKSTYVWRPARSLPPLVPRARQQALAFHSSARRADELPKSPFQTFVDVLRDELRKNRELQDNVKQLQGDVDKLQDSEAMKKARDVYERARVRPQLPMPLSSGRINKLYYFIFVAGFVNQGEPKIAGSCRGASQARCQGWRRRLGSHQDHGGERSHASGNVSSPHIVLISRHSISFPSPFVARFQKPPQPSHLPSPPLPSPFGKRLHIKLSRKPFWMH